ncbi:MAG: hypothetical protein PVH61_31390 [Candidatus Aminicenantes bacterium]
MSKIVTLILFLLVSSPDFPQYAQQQHQQSHEKIVEEVDVTNIEVAVRVFLKGEPIPGLKKEDFKLFVNGKEKEIHGFFENQKKLDESTNLPRTFLLIVNICDYYLDIENALDTLFDKIIKPNDHIILITNNFFIEDRHIPNPGEEKEKLKGILKIESGNIEQKLRILEQRLKSLLRLYKSRQKVDNLGVANSQDFILDYTQLVREFKNLYLDLGTDKYIRLAHHLKTQKGEKWVLSFYQVGRFFKPKFGSPFFRSLLGTQATSSQTFGSFDAMREYEKLREVLETEDVLPREDLVKLFTNTGATFHTILMEHGKTMQNELAADLSYVPIISDSYNLLKEISKRTGGSFINTNQFEKFYQKIARDLDIYYILTFVPDKSEANKENKIKITLNDKTQKYRISYSNLQQGTYFKKAEKKIQKETPQIRIERVGFKDNRLSFVVSNFKIKENEPSNPAAVTKLPVRIQVFNQNSQNLFDGVKMFEFTDADLQGKKAKVRLQVDFPKLPPGSYDVFIWVGDPLTGKRDLAIKAITISGNK